MRGGNVHPISRQACHLLPVALLFLSIIAPLGHSQSTISSSDIAILKTYADAFNASRNYMTPSGPAEQYCMTSGTFLAYHPCSDIPTCTQTANLVCTVSGQQGCAIDVLAADILAYKNGVDSLNAAYSSFMSGYNSFSSSNVEGSLGQMGGAFDAMKSAADGVGQSKLRLPDQIPCPCSGLADCCLGRCPEARFNYTALSSGKSAIANILLKNCIDGTPGGQCSAQKPLACVLGQLVSNTGKCGCPIGMRAAPGGSTCEFIPCTDNGVSVAEGACSPKTIGMKCANGTLVELPSACGCPQGQYLSGNACFCPSKISQACNTTNVTKSHAVAYIFDRGMEKTVSEDYTFEKTRCYSVNSTYSGAGCTNLVNSTMGSVPISETPDAQPPPGTVSVPCSRCPAICNRSAPAGLSCGACSCPANLGFCGTEGARVNLTGGARAYCASELLLPQKEDNAACAQGLECAAGECRNSLCYNRQNDPLQLFIDWVQGLFGYGK